MQGWLLKDNHFFIVPIISDLRCGCSAKVTAVKLQRYCGRIANKWHMRSFRKQGGVQSQRWGQNAKKTPAPKTQMK